MANSVDVEIYKICKNKKNVNVIADLLSTLENNNDSDENINLSVLYGVFCFYLKEGSCRILDEVELDKQNSAEYKVNFWLRERYHEYVDICLRKIRNGNVQSLDNLINIMKIDHQSSSWGKPGFNFPYLFLERILQNVILNYELPECLIEKFKSYLNYFDIQYYCLKVIKMIFKQKILLNDPGNNSLENIYQILMTITILKEESANNLNNFLNSKNVDMSLFLKKYPKVFSTAWLSFLQANLSPNLQKKILVDIESKIIPHLADPKVLIDFLTDSYNYGGVVSLLALNGLFVLINKHNLDYPDFYKKLYNLIDPTIFEMKYKSRFFHLLDLFLSSSHLPAYLVTAFVKRLARILLFTPATDMKMLLVFIRNMLTRHPSSRILINRKKMASSEDYHDPYNYEEKDPKESNAINSCLWELMTLKSHYSSDILKTLALFKKDFPKEESDISDHFDISYQEIFDAKLTGKLDENGCPPMNFVKESSFFENLDAEMWAIQ